MNILKQLALTATVIVLAAGQIFGQEFVVTPSGLEDVDGNEYGARLGNATRSQSLHFAPDFSSLGGGPLYIDGMSIRADKGQTTEILLLDDLTVNLSVTPRNSLESLFEANTGANELEVFQSSIIRIYPATGPSEGPHPFGTEVIFDTPYRYDPADGNLLVDFWSLSTDEAGARFDFHSRSLGSTLNVGNPNGSNGTPLGLELVTRFTIVPEPSAAIMAMSTMVGFVVFRRRRII